MKSNFNHCHTIFKVFIILSLIYGINSNDIIENIEDKIIEETITIIEPDSDETGDKVLPTFNEFQAKLSEQKNKNNERIIENENAQALNDSENFESEAKLTGKIKTNQSKDDPNTKNLIEPNFSPEIDKNILMRRNVADVSCGAKLLESNTVAKYPHHILNDNLDEYMNQPCNSDKFFVIEVCEPIMIRAIQIANLEMFSSRLKNFKVFVSDRYPTKTWIPIGVFQAQDQRNLQLFKLKDDHLIKFVRFEIIDHYGKEHFCPVTVVKIFGIITEELDDIQEFVPVRIQPTKPSTPSATTGQEEAPKEEVVDTKETLIDPSALETKANNGEGVVEQEQIVGENQKSTSNEIEAGDSTPIPESMKDVPVDDRTLNQNTNIQDKTVSKKNLAESRLKEEENRLKLYLVKTDVSREKAAKENENHINFFFKATQYFANFIRGTFFAREPEKKDGGNIRATINDIDSLSLGRNEITVIDYLLHMQTSVTFFLKSNKTILSWSQNLNRCITSLHKTLSTTGSLTFNTGPGQDVNEKHSLFSSPYSYYQVCSLALEYLAEGLADNFQRSNFLIRVLAGYRNITRTSETLYGPKKESRPPGLKALSVNQIANLIIEYSKRNLVDKRQRPSKSSPESADPSKADEGTDGLTTNLTSLPAPVIDPDTFHEEYVAPAGSILGLRKETAFMRLTNRIKKMEENVSVSMHYLQELSENYRIQTEKLANNSEWMQVAYAKLERMDSELNARIDFILNKLEIIERRLSWQHLGPDALFVPLDPWSHKSLTSLDRFFGVDFNKQYLFNSSIKTISGNMTMTNSEEDLFYFRWLTPPLSWLSKKCDQLWSSMNDNRNTDYATAKSNRFHNLNEEEKIWKIVVKRLRKNRWRDRLTSVGYNGLIRNITNIVALQLTRRRQDSFYSWENKDLILHRLAEIIVISIVFQVIFYTFFLQKKLKSLEERMNNLTKLEKCYEEKLKSLEMTIALQKRHQLEQKEAQTLDSSLEKQSFQRGKQAGKVFQDAKVYTEPSRYLLNHSQDYHGEDSLNGKEL